MNVNAPFPPKKLPFLPLILFFLLFILRLQQTKGINRSTVSCCSEVHMHGESLLTWVPGWPKRPIGFSKQEPYRSSNKPLFLLVHSPYLRDLSIFRQSESLALEEVTSSRGRLTDERARQTITGQVCPLYPPRAGQRKWRNLWCHKKVPEREVPENRLSLEQEP